MKKYVLVLPALLLFIFGFLAVPAVCTAQEEAPVAELSIYGEVQNVNTASGSITVQYYDYDSDEEKTTELLVAKEVKIDNAAGLADIKKGDWVDIIYTLSEGKSVAQAIVVEKEEEIPAGKESEAATEGSEE
ncbi:MAG: hypothetical protein PHP46_01940 [Candidatus Omnitrophica bacterium]|nr:hypothetical protein [Candidatus Omnitrophota bacterium]